MIHKNYNRFKEAALGATFRNDGRLLLAGSEESALKLFDVSSKNLLRVFKGHERPVHRCSFMPTDNQIVSFSDDKTVGLWDMPTEVMLHRFEGHNDYVRCGSVLSSNSDLIVSGSYDHMVKVWDKRERKEILSVDHGAPVEAVLPTPSGSLLFTAGGTYICVWDCLTGGRLLAKISQHHKTITCLKFASEHKRLVSASLDRHVKIYDMTNYEVIQTFDYSSPIVSLAVSPNDSTLTVGMSDGIIAISRKDVDTEGEPSEEKLAKETKSIRRKSKKFGEYVITDYGITKEETVVQNLNYDHYLRKFQYSKALDCVISEVFIHKLPGTTVALFQELIRRDGLRTALAGRKGKHLQRIMRFLIKHLRRPRFMRVLLQVSHVFIDLYAGQVGEDPLLDELFLRLYVEVNKEVKFMNDLMEMQGALDMVMASALTTTAGEPTLDLPSAAATDSNQSNTRLGAGTTNMAASTLEPSEAAKQAVVVNLR
jgi:U3 small nucleolar RNA-associated protein 15